MSDNVPEIILTDQGEQLMARAVAGEKVIFTRLAMGDGQVGNIGGIRGLTALIHERVSVPITKTTRKDNDLTLAGVVTLATNASPFRWRELGVLGRISAEPETLIGYLYKGETGEIVDPAEAVERSIYITVQVDADVEVTVTLAPRETLEWDQITDKPSTYTPSNHNHAWGEITGKPDTFPPATHSHAWNTITGKPSTYAPSNHNHRWSDITGKPTTFTPDSHNHSASQITSGTLGLARGGTGAATAAAARTNLGAVTGVGPTTVTLTASGWSGSGPWTQTVTVSGVTASDSHLHIYPVDVADDAARKLYDKAYGCLAAHAETVAGGIKFTCRSAKPATNFQVRIEGVR